MAITSNPHINEVWGRGGLGPASFQREHLDDRLVDLGAVGHEADAHDGEQGTFDEVAEDPTVRDADHRGDEAEHEDNEMRGLTHGNFLPGCEPCELGGPDIIVAYYW